VQQENKREESTFVFSPCAQGTLVTVPFSSAYSGTSCSPIEFGAQERPDKSGQTSGLRPLRTPRARDNGDKQIHHLLPPLVMDAMASRILWRREASFLALCSNRLWALGLTIQ
jgi:hypothetical protein